MVVEVTEHAIKRYGERVRPSLAPGSLEAEVLRLVSDIGELGWKAPSWWESRRQGIVGWIRVGDDIVFPLQFHESKRDVLVAVTCLTRGSYGEERREQRNRRAADRRRQRAARRRSGYVPPMRAA